MSEEVVNPEGELNHEINEIVSRTGSLSLTPAPRPPLVVSKQGKITLNRVSKVGEEDSIWL